MTLLNLGNTALTAGDRDSSEAAFRSILATDPNDPIALANLGILFCQTGEWGTAIEHLTSALQISPNSTSWMLPLSIAYRHDKRFDDGRETIENYLLREPSSTEGFIEYTLY